MALTALARRATAAYPRLRTLMVICGLIGASLFYGDSMITPAVSVLSAVEGLGLAFDGIDHWVVPVSLVVLVALFLVQRHGTEKIGKLFGPVMVLWFVVLAALGVQAEGSGTMNNVTFGNAGHQYYETLGSGSGAGDGFEPLAEVGGQHGEQGGGQEGLWRQRPARA